MALSVVLGLLGGALTLVGYIVYKYAYAPFQFLNKYGIKGPRPTPFLGHYKDRVKTSALEYDQFLCEKYGPISGFYIGQEPNILIADLDILKQIMVKDFDNFTDHAAFPDLFTHDSEPKDVFNSRGETWRKMRKTVSPSFSASKMKMMVPLIKRSTDVLVEVVSGMAKSEKTFEAMEVYSSFTLEAIVATAFGRRVNLQRGESDEFSKAMETTMKGLSSGQFENFILLNSHFPWLMNLFKGIYSYTETGKAMDYVAKVALDLIKARRQSGQKENYKDILQLMIEASGEEDDEDSQPAAECPADVPTIKTRKGVMTDSEVFANSMGFLIAGNETTSLLLAYTSYLLALNPDIQEKLQTEIDAYFEDKPDSSLYKAAQEITYLDNVCQESLRLYPPAVETDRSCKRTTVINGVTIPKGAVIIVPISMLHHSPLYWEDPEKFDPERFTAEEKAKRPQLCHMPFGFGPRACIGMRLALLEGKIALIELLKRFTFTRAPETEVPLKLGIGTAIRPRSGIYLKVKERAL